MNSVYLQKMNQKTLKGKNRCIKKVTIQTIKTMKYYEQNFI